MDYKLKAKEYDCLVEALRRYTRFHLDKPILACWTGLGFQSDYKQAEENGYMTIQGRYPKRALAWWLLTEKGAAIVQQWLDWGYTYEHIENGNRPLSQFDSSKMEPPVLSQQEKVEESV